MFKIKNLLFLFILSLLGCNLHSKIMTSDSYATIELGTTVVAIENRFGKPYQIISREEGQETYEYIEKITIGNQVIEQRRYYIVMQQGKVIGKYMKISNPPPLQPMYSEDPYPNY